MSTIKSSKKKPKSNKPKLEETNSHQLDLIETTSNLSDIKFKIKDIVYLKLDNEQLPRLITGILIRPNDTLTYCLACGTNESWHYDFEISKVKDIIKATTN